MFSKERDFFFFTGKEKENPNNFRYNYSSVRVAITVVSTRISNIMVYSNTFL